MGKEKVTLKRIMRTRCWQTLCVALENDLIKDTNKNYFHVSTSEKVPEEFKLDIGYS